MTGQEARIQRELKRITLQRLRAANDGDKKAYSRHVSSDGIFTDGNGQAHSAAEMIQSVSPPHTVLDQRFTGIRDWRANIVGDTAVINYVLRAERVGTRRGRTEYRKTDTFVKRRGQWEIIAVQATLIPTPDNSRVVIDARLGDYVGDYRLSRRLVARVRKNNNKLTLTISGNKAMQLVSQRDGSFLAIDELTRVIFLRDREDQFASLAFRKYPGGSDLSAPRVK